MRGVDVNVSAIHRAESLARILERDPLDAGRAGSDELADLTVRDDRFDPVFGGGRDDVGDFAPVAIPQVNPRRRHVMAPSCSA
jgi:hypothetical protein